MTEAAVATPAPTPASPGPSPTPTPTPAPGIETLAAQPGTAAETTSTLITEPGKEGDKPAPAAAAVDVAKLTAPEGLELNADAMKAFAELLSGDTPVQDRAQNLLNMHAEAVKAAVQAATEASSKAWSDTNDQWIKDVKSDAVIGGTNLESTRQTIAKAIDSLGAEGAKAFREGLNATGAGNHPGIIKGLLTLAKAMTESSSNPTGNPPNRPANIAQAFYPNMK